MPKAAHQTSLLGLVGSDTEEGFGLVAASSHVPGGKTTATRRPVMPPKKVARGRPAASRVTKPAQSTATRQTGRRSQDSSDKATKHSGAGRGRPAKSLPNTVIPDSQPPPGEGDAVLKKGKGSRGRLKATREAALPPEADSDLEGVGDATFPEAGQARARRGRPPKKPASPEPQPEQQPAEDAMDVDEEEEEEEEDVGDQIEDLPAAPPKSRTTSVSRQHSAIHPSSVLRRPLAAEQGTSSVDPTLRRRIGELSQKYDNLEQKYKDLREIGIKEAERNFDKLKKQSDERAETANRLVASLKEELATQTAIAKESTRVKGQLDESTYQAEELRKRVEELATALADSKAQIKSLNTKLAASRTAEAANPRLPGSALKGSSVAAAKQAASNDAAQLGQAKGELYCDLTGLIITGVKRDGEEDVFDCVQTGRNGALHFKLGVTIENSADAFEDAEFQYNPQLDPHRDRALIDMLPDFLVDEITFPRPQASKFYARVMKALTE